MIPRWCEQRANAVKCEESNPIFVKYRNRIRIKRFTEVADLRFPDGKFFCRDIGDRNSLAARSDDMVLSQNARFSGEAAPDAEFDHPPGASIARLLQVALAKRGWEVFDINNWRDGGWSITCHLTSSRLELVIAKMAVGEEWFLQITPTYAPGLVGWLLKKQASASPDAIQALAQDAFLVLSATGRFQEFMWCWDGPPEPGSSTPQPVPESSSS